MVSKDFERTIRFYEVKDSHGNSVMDRHGKSMWFPIVEAVLLIPAGGRVTLSLLFDTGANFTTLRADLYPLLGLTSWDQGVSVDTGTGGGRATAYEYNGQLEIFGKTINCPIHLLATLQPHPLFCGLLGRHTIFEQFGFGFWEKTCELHVTTNP